MTPQETLNALYEEWRVLTAREAEAITAGAWDRLAQQQAAKAALQPKIVAASDRLAATRSISPQQHSAAESHLRGLVTELISMEQANQRLLRAAQNRAVDQRESLDAASRHLRQIHRSYVPASEAHWQSYS